MYKDFMTGLDGSPMPSFSDNVTPDQGWNLVFYLRTLQPENTKEKQIAKQLGLTPINPYAQPPADNSAPSNPTTPPPAQTPPANPPSTSPQSNNSGKR
jgi:hypothetical protein